ncbi:MAG: hypothetical protein NC548_18585 [Lachnospiraceae bacterium]|nr:hypothetical protein [Lachnospiraceae bacterium]
MLRGESPYSSLREYLAKNLLTTVAEFPDSHAQSLTYQVGQMKSAGALTLTDDNNPGGIVGVTFKAHIPETNVLDKEYWTEDADGNVAAYDETKNPIEDIRKFLNKLLYDGTYGSVHAEIDEDTFYKLIGHPEFKKAIGYMVVNGLFTATTSIEDADKRATEAGANVLLVDGNDTTALVGYFKRLFRGISEVTLHNNVVGVAKFNPETKQFGYPTVKAFNEGVLLFRPVGNIGTIKNVVPLRPDGSAVVAGIFENRGIIEYRYNPETRVQAWESELTVLAVPNRPKKMYRFNLAKKAINGRTAARRTTTSPKAE